MQRVVGEHGVPPPPGRRRPSQPLVGLGPQSAEAGPQHHHRVPVPEPGRIAVQGPLRLPLTHVEQWVPVIFALSYLVGFCAVVSR
ncbi:hypothetical protein K4G64_19520 [Streptomyces sp. WAC04114]|nr:hypothetical protein [Streptomyces sp. WAC04114]